jgi:integrase
MVSTKGLNEAVIKALPIPNKGNKLHFFAGAVLQGARVPRGFAVRVTSNGAKAFVLDYRIRQRQYRYTIGTWPDWSALRAVREARELRQRVDRGENPLDDRAAPPTAKTVADVIDEFLSRYVSGKLRSAKEYERAFARFVKPAIGTETIHNVRRSQIAEMLDRIEDKSGAVMADRTLAYLRKAFNWYAARDDRFVPPIVKGMARTKPRERARDRVLSDEEIRLIWPQLTGIFGAYVKTLLFTGQRKEEVSRLTWSEIDDKGVWTIPAERYKTRRANVVPLSSAARRTIEAQLRIDGCEYVFAGRTGKTPFSGFSKAKSALDKATGVTGWTLHDLRRTAKTLMVRAGVRPDISERVLGHVIAGVEGVYDRHSYLDEKREALERLAAMVESILNPAPANVLPFDELSLGRGHER